MSTVSARTDTSVDAAPTDPGEMRPVRERDSLRPAPLSV